MEKANKYFTRYFLVKAFSLPGNESRVCVRMPLNENPQDFGDRFGLVWGFCFVWFFFKYLYEKLTS